MRMFLVRFNEPRPSGPVLVDCVREDIEHDGVPAVFYTREEARAFIAALCGLMHTGGDPKLFEVWDIEYDLDGITYEGRST